MKSIVYLVSLAIIMVLPSCYLENGGFGIRGEGPVVERKVSLEPIKGISVPGSAHIYLTQGSQQEVRITGQENVLDNLRLEVRGDVWEIGYKRPVWKSEPVKVFITLETLRIIKISGSGNVTFENHFDNLKDLEVRISGSGKMNMDLDARDINAVISGSGDLYMKGSTNYLDTNISGSGGIKAFDLTAQKADVRISGSGGMELTVEDRLDARVSGSGSIYYQGDPKVKTAVSGSGKVRSR